MVLLNKTMTDVRANMQCLYDSTNRTDAEEKTVFVQHVGELCPEPFQSEEGGHDQPAAQCECTRKPADHVGFGR